MVNNVEVTGVMVARKKAFEFRKEKQSVSTKASYNAISICATYMNVNKTDTVRIIDELVDEWGIDSREVKLTLKQAQACTSVSQASKVSIQQACMQDTSFWKSPFAKTENPTTYTNP